MTLSQKQQHFALMVAELIVWINQQTGLTVTLGEAYRPPEMAEIYAKQGKGIVKSLHCEKLAIDLNLFSSGFYQPDTEAHRPIGEKWESMDPLNRWGGRFKRKDGGHYEFNG